MSDGSFRHIATRRAAHSPSWGRNLSAFELSLVASRILNVAFDLWLLFLGVRALRAAPGSFTHRAGVTLVMLGGGLLLTQVDRVAPDPSRTIVSIVLWLGIALAILGCARLIRLVRSPDRDWSGVLGGFDPS